MARKFGPTISQEELYPRLDQLAREELDDARLLDLDVEQESPFLRGQKRVSVRRGTLPKRAAVRLTWAAVSAVVVLFFGIALAALYHYGERSWRFRINSSDDIEIGGLQNVTRFQVMEVMGGDIGRNIFFVPLAQRKAQLEQIPWVQSASVMRFVPNRLRVEIHERTPVAFARVGPKILLVDGAGTVMDLPLKKKYSFPVILGMNSGEPLSTRGARMKIYNNVVSQLDSGGGRYTQDLSEVDLADPEDVKVLANSPQGEVLVHLGSANYLERYKVYVSHVQEWRQQFDQLESVDLRYDRQIIVNPDLQGPAKQAPLSALAAKQAMAAGVKPAALISHVIVGPKPAVAAVKAPVPPRAKPAIRKKLTRRRTKNRRAKANAKAVITPVQTNAAGPGAAPDSAPSSSPPGPGQNAKASAGKKPSPAIAKGQDKEQE